MSNGQVESMEFNANSLVVLLLFFLGENLHDGVVVCER